MRQVVHLNQPEHSIIGASKAHQWIECPGSVGLTSQIFLEIEAVGGNPEGKSSVYAKQGTAAHDLATRCLRENADAWEYQGQQIEVEGEMFTVDQEMVDGVQIYLDHIRGLQKERVFHKGQKSLFVEEKFQLTEISKHAYGTVDCGLLSKVILDVVDFKYGAGIIVEVEENPQVLMYATGMLLSLPKEQQRQIGEIYLHIVQPRAPHPDGPVRTWKCSITWLRRWINETLIPRMQAALQPHAELKMGEWCRYCPALARCPLQNKALQEVRFENHPTKIPDKEIGRTLDQLEAMLFYHKQIKSEIHGRLLHGRSVPGWKLVEGKANRVWRDGAEDAAKERFGDQRFRQSFRSPAQFDELGPAGKEFAAEWAHKPKAPDALARESDAKPATKPVTADEAFASVNPPIAQ